MNSFLPEGSICERCGYCMIRNIEPLNNEDWEIEGNENAGVMIHAICLLTEMDLHDHVVHACNKFDGVQDAPNPFLNNRFLR